MQLNNLFISSWPKSIVACYKTRSRAIYFYCVLLYISVLGRTLHTQSSSLHLSFRENTIQILIKRISCLHNALSTKDEQMCTRTEQRKFGSDSSNHNTEQWGQFSINFFTKKHQKVHCHKIFLNNRLATLATLTQTYIKFDNISIWNPSKVLGTNVRYYTFICQRIGGSSLKWTTKQNVHQNIKFLR